MSTTTKCVSHFEGDKCAEIRDVSNSLFREVMAAIQEDGPVTSGGPGMQNQKAALVEHVKVGSAVKRSRPVEPETQRKKKITRGKRTIVCAWCKTTESPEWRTGPQFSKL
jgi:hypothetical protein